MQKILQTASEQMLGNLIRHKKPINIPIYLLDGIQWKMWKLSTIRKSYWNFTGF